MNALSLPHKENELPEKKIGWWDLPLEMREMVIEKMDDVTKLVFLLSSDDFAVEMPRKFIKYVDLKYSILNLKVNNKTCLYTISFSPNHDDNKCTITYTGNRCDGEHHNRMFLNFVEEGKNSEVIIKYFQRIIYNVTELDDLYFNSTFFSPNKTTIRHLKLLNSFALFNIYKDDIFNCGFMDPKQLCSVTGNIYFEHVSLTLNQLQNSEFESIYGRSMEIPSEDINQFLKLFVCGKLQKNLRDVNLDTRLHYLLDNKKVVDGLTLLSKEEYEGRASFLLVCPVNGCKIANVCVYEGIKMKIYSKEVFDAEPHLRRRYGPVVDEYLKNFHLNNPGITQ